jgi:hypothetical protein
MEANKLHYEHEQRLSWRGAQGNARDAYESPTKNVAPLSIVGIPLTENTL